MLDECCHVMSCHVSCHIISCRPPFLGLFKRRSSLLDLTLEEDRSLVMQMCLKCGDLSHPSRPRKLHLKWSELVTEVSDEVI